MSRAATGTLLTVLASGAACHGVPEAKPHDAVHAVPAAPADARHPFLPADYEGESLVDFAAMRRCGLLDRLERLPMMEDFLASTAASFGCELDDLRCVRTATVYEASGGRGIAHAVSVATVTAPVQPALLGKSCVPVRLGGRDAWRWKDDSRTHQELLVAPYDGLVVRGVERLLAPILDGPPGAAHPELQPLLSGDGVLFQYAFCRCGRPMSVQMGTIGFPASWEGGDDPAEAARFRLAAVGAGDLEFAVTLRFLHGREGLQRIETELREQIETLAADKNWAVLRPLLRQVTVTRDGRDLTAALRLGPPREAVARVERVVLALAAKMGERQP